MGDVDSFVLARYGNGRFRPSLRRWGFVACAIAGTLTLAPNGLGALGGWTAGGPEGALATSVVVHPTAPGVVYAGVQSGIYRSANSGLLWDRVYDHEGVYIEVLAIAPTSPPTVFANDGGLVRSTDEGRTWSRTSLPGTYPTAVVVHPSQPSTVYASVSGSGVGVYRSDDAGVTWRRLSEGLIPPVSTSADDVLSLAISPSDPSVLFAGKRGYPGMFKSVDGGLSWEVSGLPNRSPADNHAIAVDPSSPDTIYIGGGGVAKSTDGGATWVGLRGPVDPVSGVDLLNHVRAIVISPTSPTTILVGTAWAGVFRTEDGGQSWERTNSGLGLAPFSSDMPAPDLAIDSFGTIFAAAAGPSIGGGVFSSRDGGSTWAATSKGITSTQVSSIAVTPTRSHTVFTSYLGFVYRTTDSGMTWTRDQAGLPGRQVGAVGISPANPDQAFAAVKPNPDGSGQPIFGSSDGGRTWTPTAAAFGGYSTALVVTPGASPTILAGPDLGSGEFGRFGLGVYRSVNLGASWTFAFLDPVEMPQLADLAVDPRDPAIVYATTQTQSVFKSRDRGLTWTIALRAPYVFGANGIVVAPSDSSTVYAALGQNGVYKSADGGWSWTRTSAGLPAVSVNDVTVHPRSASVVYAATDDGVFTTGDGGATWAAAAGGLPGHRISFIAMHPLEPFTVFAATRGSGVFTLTPAIGLSVAVVANSPKVLVNQVLRSSLKVTNAGPQASAATRLIIDAPGAIGVTSTKGACSLGQTITCELGVISAQDAATIEVSRRAVVVGSATGRASVSGVESEPSSGDNAATWTTSIERQVIRRFAPVCIAQRRRPTEQCRLNLRFVLSHPSAVSITLRRIGSTRVRFVGRFNGKSGSNRIAVPATATKRLPRGRYIVTLRAESNGIGLAIARTRVRITPSPR